MSIILASKSEVRKKILEKYNIECVIEHSNVDEDLAKESLLAAGADPLIISKNLAEMKSIKVSLRNPNRIVLGADSVISHNNQLINKPSSREDALKILKKLNNSVHYLISSVCISKNGAMVWNYSDSSELHMKNLDNKDLESYLSKVKTKILLAYGVYQIEAGGLELFKSIKGDKESIMGLPIKQIEDFLKNFK